MTATVTARGTARRRVPATSVVLRGELVAAGGDRQASFDELVVGQQRVSEALGDAVTFTRVTSHDTRDERGWQVHRHAAALELAVDDVGGVGAAVGELVGFGVEVHGADWRIEEDAPVHADVRRAAVEDAVARARDYAAAVGSTLGPLVSVSDGVGRAEPAPRALAAHGAAGGELAIAPQPVTVVATAEVRFELVAD